jgi:hypothetical protein
VSRANAVVTDREEMMYLYFDMRVKKSRGGILGEEEGEGRYDRIEDVRGLEIITEIKTLTEAPQILTGDHRPSIL